MSGRSVDKCARLDLYDNGQGFLFLKDVLASTACLISRRAVAGDHTLFLANMLSGDVHTRNTWRRQLLLSDLDNR